MVSPNTLEWVGIVVGSALLLGLPTGVLVSPFVSGITGWQAVLLWLVPGVVVVGALVAWANPTVQWRGSTS